MGSWVEQTVSRFRGLDLQRLSIDEAFVNVSSRLQTPVWMYSLSDECHRCPYSRVQEIRRQHVLRVSTKYGVNWRFFDKDVGPYTLEASTEARVVCDLRPDMGEFGVYDVLIDDTEKCAVTTALEPVNIYLPFVVFIIILLCLIISIRGICIAKHYYRRRSEENAEEEQQASSEIPARRRLRSLDTFRGLCIVLMVFVNSGAGGYTQLEHATWNGIHFADVIFPWFLWIMGVCIPMSVKSQLVRNATKKDMLLNVLRRSITLFAIGVCLNTIWGAQLENLRIFGVLQRFGVAYFVVASLHIIFRKIGSLPPQNAIARAVYDIRLLLAEWGVMLLIVAVHLILAFGLSVPGCGRGYLGPGGMHEMLRYNHCIGGATGYIDRLILTTSHIYQHPTAVKVYGSSAFDPEGAFGCLLTIFQVFLGVQCGAILLVHSDWRSRVKRWTVWGAVLGIVGAALCEFKKEDGLIPINKNMWSLSFVLVTSGLAFILLAAMYVVVDVRAIWRGAPLVYAGMNAIAIYVGHQVFHKMLPWHWSIGAMNTHFVRLLESGWTTALWVGIAYYLYKRKLFYSV
ncbi:heparan-alpha-glucosaminide N-acetyltransferase-like [Phlebotomus argentipes]|uniref:heparan-alpha-glucosaminide N-acetyltransferase-like n=1 Tax=Phlebotomus argentipes TaxID=94469 RepID=UPI0028931891|nr:heparan-alpha-glucosaminide N-acetyltransferase-like [Phlebotomus argentipes]